MSLHEHTGPVGNARDHLAVIEEHREGVTFESAPRLLSPDTNSATREAIVRACEAAWDAFLASDSERVRSLPLLGLIEARDIMLHAALLSLAEHYEEFNKCAATNEDVDQEITAVADVLREGPLSVMPRAEGWDLRRSRSVPDA